MDVYVKYVQLRTTVISSISLAIHFLTLKQEYMTMTTDNITPIAVRFEQRNQQQDLSYDQPIIRFMEHTAQFLRCYSDDREIEFTQEVEDANMDSFPEEYKSVVGMKCGYSLVVSMMKMNY